MRLQQAENFSAYPCALQPVLTPKLIPVASGRPKGEWLSDKCLKAALPIREISVPVDTHGKR